MDSPLLECNLRLLSILASFFVLYSFPFFDRLQDPIWLLFLQGSPFGSLQMDIGIHSLGQINSYFLFTVFSTMRSGFYAPFTFMHLLNAFVGRTISRKICINQRDFSDICLQVDLFVFRDLKSPDCPFGESAKDVDLPQITATLFGFP